MAIRVTPAESEKDPISKVARKYLDWNIQDIKKNMLTQCVYPAEVYTGYRKVNEMRKRRGMWYSTGEGRESFSGRVYEADDARGQFTIGIQFNDYLRYVDLGVGLTGSPRDPAAHITVDKVQRGKPMDWRSRYIRGKWNRRKGKSHRPAIMRTIRRLCTRYENYMADFYGEQGGVVIINSLAGIMDNAKL